MVGGNLDVKHAVIYKIIGRAGMKYDTIFRSLHARRSLTPEQKKIGLNRINYTRVTLQILSLKEEINLKFVIGLIVIPWITIDKQLTKISLKFFLRSSVFRY